MAFTTFHERVGGVPDWLAAARLLDAGLSGDVLFGSDFPNIPYPYGEAVDALERLGPCGDAWMRSVLYSNAADLFGLRHSIGRNNPKVIPGRCWREQSN